MYVRVSMIYALIWFLRPYYRAQTDTSSRQFIKVLVPLGLGLRVVPFGCVERAMQLRTPKIHMANFNQENEFCCVSVQLHCAL